MTPRAEPQALLVPLVVLNAAKRYSMTWEAFLRHEQVGSLSKHDAWPDTKVTFVMQVDEGVID